MQLLGDFAQLAVGLGAAQRVLGDAEVAVEEGVGEVGGAQRGAEVVFERGAQAPVLWATADSTSSAPRASRGRFAFCASS